MLRREELMDLVRDLQNFRDPELVLLKGHMLVERQLTAAVAARLRVEDEHVPRAGFATIAEFAMQHAPERQEVLWLNSLRNVAAHEYHGLKDAQFEKLVACYGLPWPTGVMERCAIMQIVVNRAFWIAYRQTVQYLRAGAKGPERKRLSSIDELVRDLIKINDNVAQWASQGRWNDVVGACFESAKPSSV